MVMAYPAMSMDISAPSFFQMVAREIFPYVKVGRYKHSHNPLNIICSRINITALFAMEFLSSYPNKQVTKITSGNT